LKDTLLWSLRNPDKAMASIIKLKSVPISVSWSSYPHGARSEIEKSAKALKHRKLVTQELAGYWDRYQTLKQKNPLRFTREDEVFIGALCWRLKQEMLNICRPDENMYVVQYEKLIQDPETEIHAILQFLNIPWHENVMKHHLLHSDISIGKTESSRPIDAKNLEKWKAFLSEDDVKTIEQICADAAKDFYNFNSLQALAAL